MKKITLLASAMTVAVAAWAQVAEPTAIWAKNFTDSQKSGTSQGSSIALASDGGVYTVGGFGTTTADDQIMWGAEAVAPGTECLSTSSSGNQTFMLSKIDVEGNMDWRVYTENAEVSSNESWVAGTPDGVVAFFNIRHANSMGDKDIVFVDGNDNRYTYNWTLGEAGASRYFTGIVMKVLNDGTLDWFKPIVMNHDGQPNATTYKDITSQGIYCYAVDVDAQGNIYVGGNMRTTMTIANGDDNVVIEPHNVDGWDGDSQKSVGNLFILKLDGNGNYLGHIVTGGQAKYESIRDIKVGNNNLYFFGLLTGNEEQGTVTLGGKEITTLNANGGIIAGCIDTDLQNAKWLSYFNNTKTGGVLQTPGLRVYNNRMWIMGKTNMQGLQAGEKVLSAEHTRDAMLLKLDASSGELVDGHMKLTNQAGYFDCFEDEDGYVYVAGHVLVKPVTLEKFDINNLDEPENTWELANNSSDTQGIAINNDGILYAMFRSNAALTFINSDVTIAKPSKFSCVVSAFQMPVKELPTAISSVNAEKTLKAVRYFNATGIESATPHPGFNIMVKHYSDGSREVVKIMR